jgi:nickel-dependent lactate racemase
VAEIVTAGPVVRLPWGAWTGEWIDLEMPAGWRVVELSMRDAPALSDAAIGQALDAPLGTEPLEALARSRTRAAIAIDDITRPTRTAPILGQVVSRLVAAGVPHEAITVLIATGAHRAATEADIRLKVGELAGRVRVISHDPIGDVVGTGVSLGGQPVRVNREFLAADLRIGIGCVMPHPFAGYSGGGKIVLPGLADLESVVRSHKYALMGFGGGLKLQGNKFRRDMETAVREIGLDFSISVAMNSRCETAALVAGDVVEAHRAAAARAAEIGETAPPPEPLDALVLNAYPKDSELLQVEAALVAVRAGMVDWLKPSAPVVLLAACPDGLGSHQLFGPGGRLFRKPTRKAYLGERELLVVSPASDRDPDRAAFWDGYRCAASWSSGLNHLHVQAGSLVGYGACGPLHVPRAGGLS